MTDYAWLARTPYGTKATMDDAGEEYDAVVEHAGGEENVTIVDLEP